MRSRLKSSDIFASLHNVHTCTCIKYVGKKCYTCIAIMLHSSRSLREPEDEARNMGHAHNVNRMDTMYLTPTQTNTWVHTNVNENCLELFFIKSMRVFRTFYDFVQTSSIAQFHYQHCVVALCALHR